MVLVWTKTNIEVYGFIKIPNEKRINGDWDLKTKEIYKEEHGQFARVMSAAFFRTYSTYPFD